MRFNRKYKSVILIAFVAALVTSCLRPIYPAEMFLQHSVTLLMLIFLGITAVKNSLSDRSFTIIVIFMLLHLIGARWIYSYVPYDEWFEFLSGKSLSGISGFSRNNYDRFVHLMFGLLIFSPVREISEKWFGCPGKLSGLLSFLTIAGFSLFYEVFEWGLTLVLSPQDAEDYNGQQGDMWDAQKDMALAFTGALVSLMLHRARTWYRERFS
jgi:putative membrane protein